MIAYKYRSGQGTIDKGGKDVFIRDVDLLAENRIFLPTIAQLNDPTEAMVEDFRLRQGLNLFSHFFDTTQYVVQAYEKLRDNIANSGIYSLSKCVDSELMWAYYASGHTGYAVIWDMDVLSRSMNENFSMPSMFEFDVRYSKSLPKIDLSIFYDKTQDANSIITKLIGWKSKSWEHEMEHRLVFDKGGNVLQIDYRAIRGFVFGCLMKEEDADYIMEKFKGRGMKYYQMKLSKNSYVMKMKEVTDRYPMPNNYIPNVVAYDIDQILMPYVTSEDFAQYRTQMLTALQQVSKEPFVTRISHAVFLNGIFTVWTDIKQDGVVFPVRKFEFPMA